MMPQYIAQNANAYIVFYVCLGLCKSFYLRMCQIVHKFWKDLHFPLSFLRDGYWLVHFAMMPLLSLYYIQQLKMSKNQFHELDSRMGSGHPCCQLILANLKIRCVIIKWTCTTNVVVCRKNGQIYLVLPILLLNT